MITPILRCNLNRSPAAPNGGVEYQAQRCDKSKQRYRPGLPVSVVTQSQQPFIGDPPEQHHHDSRRDHGRFEEIILRALSCRRADRGAAIPVGYAPGNMLPERCQQIGCVDRYDGQQSCYQSDAAEIGLLQVTFI